MERSQCCGGAYYLIRHVETGHLLYKDLQTGVARVNNVSPKAKIATWQIDLSGDRVPENASFLGATYIIRNKADSSYLGSQYLLDSNANVKSPSSPLEVKHSEHERWVYKWHIYFTQTHTKGLEPVSNFYVGSFAIRQ